MKTCAFAIPGDPDSKTGGYIYDRDLIAALRASGRRVEVLRLGESFPDPSPADAAAALRVLRAVPADRPLILDGLVFGALGIEALAHVHAPMIVMLHHPLGLEAGLAPDRARALLALEAANLRLAKHIVVPSPHVARLVSADFGVPADRISVALPGFRRPAGPDLPKDDPPLILSVGLICVRKGHDVFLDALARLTDLSWQATIVGLIQDAPLAAALRARCEQPGLAGRVRFAGCVSDAELQALYARASLFALATRYEGYGMAFGEAMLHGLPIVTCAVGAVPDTVPEAAGLLVPPDDAPAFAAALRRLLRDPADRATRVRAARRAALDLPDWADSAAVMAAALDRVCVGARS
jgi:glycosyltransferase involved in cell wall biosynthesis